MSRTRTPALDDLSAARIRHALRELDDLDPAMVEEFLAHPKHGPLLMAALDDRRRWSCPICGVIVYAKHAPAGWLVVEPFTRVAACSWCAPHIKQGTLT